jgi:hypothetical protein
MEKELENPEKKKKESNPAAHPTHLSPARPRAPAPAPPDRWTPPVSGSSPARALSLPRSLAALRDQLVGASFPSPARSPSLSLFRGPGSLATEPLPPRVPFSLSAPWTLPIRSAFPAPTVDRRVRTCARHRVSRPRRRPCTQLPSYSPAGALRTPLASFRTPSPSLALCPRRQPPSETRARVPDHPAHRRLRPASPSSAPR